MNRSQAPQSGREGFMTIGTSVPRVDSYDKAAGRTKYVDDLCSSRALVAKILHSNVAHAYVKYPERSSGCVRQASADQTCALLRR